MTQVIAVATHEYVLMASDRRLSNPISGQMVDDDTCKLVALCNHTAIAYTGLAKLGGMDTYRWIVNRLSSNDCISAPQAVGVLTKCANEAFRNSKAPDRRHCFLLAGWALFDRDVERSPFLATISNALDKNGRMGNVARDRFQYYVEDLKPNSEWLIKVVGFPIDDRRIHDLKRNIRKLIERKIGPNEMLRLLVDEIFLTSSKHSQVGKKILAMSIPKKPRTMELFGQETIFLSSKPPTENPLGPPISPDVPTFYYYDPNRRELVSYGPAFVCGRTGVSTFKATSYPRAEQQ